MSINTNRKTVYQIYDQDFLTFLYNGTDLRNVKRTLKILFRFK